MNKQREENDKVLRMGEVIKVKPEMEARYRQLHDNIWPEQIANLDKAGFRNFNIFYRDGYLFKYCEYVGDNYEEDMKILAENEKNIEWLSNTDPCQEPIDSAKEKGEWWAPMEHIFHL